MKLLKLLIGRQLTKLKGDLRLRSVTLYPLLQIDSHSVSSAIPICPMQTVKSSVHVCKMLVRLNKNLLWGTTDQKKRDLFSELGSGLSP